MSTTPQWWQQLPVTRYGTDTGHQILPGVPDVEKGDVYAVPPGTPISIPIPSRIAWEDNQHVVLQTYKNVLNFLHVNPTEPVGTEIPANQSFGTVSYIGSPGYPGSYTDPHSGVTYWETGGVVEFGNYDTVEGARKRDVWINNVDYPYNFQGINDPANTTMQWRMGNTPNLPPPDRSSSFPSWGKWVLIGLAILLIWRYIH